MSNKSSRTLINIVGLPLTLLLIYLGDIYFNFIIYVAIIISTREFNEICKRKKVNLNIFWIYISYLILFPATYFNHKLFTIYFIELFFIFILILFIAEIFRNKERPFENISCSIFCFIWIGLSLISITIIRNFEIHGFLLTLAMFLSVWICDTFAFYFGSKFGRKKLLKAISPNKTWLGSVAGFISVLIFNYILFSFGMYIFFEYNFSIYDVLVFSFIFGIISQFGDLFESMIKRSVEIKDSGTILRGHGGFLDRMDSLMFVAPLFYLYLKFVMGLNG